MKNKQLAAAKRHYSELVRKHPKDPEAWGQLGMVNSQLGRFPDALNCFQRVTEIDPGSVPGHLCLAQTQIALSRLEEATFSLRRVLVISPNHIQAAISLAQICESQGRLDDAMHYYRITVNNEPRLTDGLLGLGRTLEAIGQYGEAETCYQRALEMQPGHANALLHLGALSLKRGALYRAVEYNKRATQCQPESATAYYSLGWVESVLGHTDNALVSYQTALQIDPGCVDAIGGKASIYAQQGKYQKAYDQIRPSVEQGTASVQIAVVFSDICKSLKTCDQAIEYAQLTLSNQNITYDSRIALRHVLGKLYDSRGEYDTAFEQYQQANAMQAKGPAPEIHEEYIDSLIRVWNKKFYASAAKATITTELPVFIVGMPRSGTTLVEQILAAHPAVYGGGELPYMQKMVMDLPSLSGSTQAYPDCLTENVNPEIVELLSKDYLAQLRELSGDAQLVTDKMWANYEHLGLISRLFTGAKIIHCVRDPLDTCLSIYFQYFSGRLPFANDLEHIGRYYMDYWKLMRHWSGLLDIPILDVKYEELVDQQEAVTVSVLEFCNLPWDKRCLEFYDVQRVTRTISQEQVHQPMYRTSLRRWKHYENHISTLKAALHVDDT